MLAAAALNRLCQIYRASIVRWFEQARLTHADAEDATQEFLMHVFGGPRLNGFVRGKRRFRSWLVAYRLHQPDPVRLVTLSPDESKLASAGASQVFLWQFDPNRTNPVTTIPLPEPRCLVFSPDSKRLAVSGLGETTARILDAVGGGDLGSCEAHATPIEHLRFSPDNSLLATASQGGQIRLWNAADARPVTAWISIGAKVTGMRFRPD